MTIAELIEQLKTLPQEAKVLLSIDPEGNGFNEYSGDEWVCNWDGEEVHLRPEDLNDQTRKLGYTEEDCGDGELAVVLWP